MRSRSRSRDRRFVRDRDGEYRDKPRDVRGSDRGRDRYTSNRRSASRSRSRDRGDQRGRDFIRSGKLEVREVKRILSSNDRSDRRDGASRLAVNKDLNAASETRKISYDEYVKSDRLKNDDEVKVKRSRIGEYAPTDNDAAKKEDKPKKEESANDSKENAVADDAYDDKALEEIEKFLSSTTTEKVKDKSGAEVDQTESDADDLVVLWEDEEEKQKREEKEAEERRKKRQEIARKYSTASLPTSPVGAKIGTARSPTSLGRQRAHTIPETPSTKSEVPVIDVSSVISDGNTGGSSISVPATIHLAKLDLGGEEDIYAGSTAAVKQEPLVGNAVSAAVRAVLPTLNTAVALDDDDELTPTSTKIPLVVEADAEGRQLEAEKSALEMEERKEQRGATKGYGGGYGAGGRVEFDMFSSSPSAIEQAGRTGYLGADGKYADTGMGGRRALREALLDGEGGGGGGAEDPHLQSNWDDGEGYYKARIGELVGERFQILGVVGKGVFSTVLKCIDLRGGDGTSNVAVKMIRNNDTMRKAAEKEKAILLSIAEHDPDNKKYCVRLLTHLEYRNHVALVFEYQTMNLRETLKKFGKDVGINIGAVRMYGRQLFVALKHLMDLRIVHADIKLDNILCSADLKQVKLCDFGSAFLETDTDNDPTPYLVSRFYRAPEIILGQQYDRAIDLWSVCASLYELFTGHVMFPGRTNNEMLKLMMAVKGRFPNKLIKAHMRSYEVLSLEPHFDPDMRFRQYEADPITGKTILRLIDITNPTRDLAAVLRSSKAGADDMKLVTAFTDMLEKGLNLDPAKRMTVVEAFRHPFLSSK